MSYFNFEYIFMIVYENHILIYIYSNFKKYIINMK